MNNEQRPAPTSAGVPVTDELINQLAAEAEAGYDVTQVRRRGRRRMGSAPAEIVPVRLDPELREALAARAESEHTTASEVIRQAVRAWLRTA